MGPWWFSQFDPAAEDAQAAPRSFEVDNLERVEQGGQLQTNPCVHEVFVAELADEVKVCKAEGAVVGWRKDGGGRLAAHPEDQAEPLLHWSWRAEPAD